MTRRIRVRSPLADLMISSLTCDFGCCQLEAFNNSAALIEEWQRKQFGNDLKKCLEQLSYLIASATSVTEDVEFSVGMQSGEFREGKVCDLREVFYFVAQKEWIDFLREWKKEILKVAGL